MCDHQTYHTLNKPSSLKLYTNIYFKNSFLCAFLTVWTKYWSVFRKEEEKPFVMLMKSITHLLKVSKPIIHNVKPENLGELSATCLNYDKNWLIVNCPY
jgi:hypothetical protein